MQMSALLQVHVTSTEAAAHRNARATQQFFALYSCRMIGLDFIELLLVTLKFSILITLISSHEKRKKIFKINYIQNLAMALQCVYHVRVRGQRNLSHFIIYLRKLQQKPRK